MCVNAHESLSVHCQACREYALDSKKNLAGSAGQRPANLPRKPTASRAAYCTTGRNWPNSQEPCMILDNDFLWNLNFFRLCSYRIQAFKPVTCSCLMNPLWLLAASSCIGRVWSGACSSWVTPAVRSPCRCEWCVLPSFPGIWKRYHSSWSRTATSTRDFTYGSVILVACCTPYGVLGFDFTPGRFGPELAKDWTLSFAACLEAAMLVPCNFCILLHAYYSKRGSVQCARRKFFGFEAMKKQQLQIANPKWACASLKRLAFCPKRLPRTMCCSQHGSFELSCPWTMVRLHSAKACSLPCNGVVSAFGGAEKPELCHCTQRSQGTPMSLPSPSEATWRHRILRTCWWE